MPSDVALFRLSVLGTLTSRVDIKHGELKQLIKEQASKKYAIPNSKKATLSYRTIERWYYQWVKHGVSGLEPKLRNDQGKSKLSEEVQKLILDYKQEDRSRSLTTILELAGHNGFKNLPRSSVHRLLSQNNLSSRVLSDAPSIERREFLAKHSNEIWYGDVMHGPKINTNKGLKKVYLITILDDASRLVAHAEFSFDEKAISIEHVLKEAVMRRGIPSRLIVDNGSAYRSESLQGICARLDIRLIYCRPYEPQAKGKLERWHRTIRDQFISELNLSIIRGLDDINIRILAWLEQLYHQRKHSSLDQTPLQRYRQDIARIRLLGEKAKDIDDIFYHRVKRFVKKTGVVSYCNKDYEVPYQYSGSYINIVVDPYERKAKYLESLDGQKVDKLIELDPLSNAHRERQRPDKPKSKPIKKHSLVEDALTSYQNKYKLED